MKKEDLKNKTTTTLQSELKQTKSLTGVLIGVLIVLFAVTMYGLIAKEDKKTYLALIAVAISCSAILPSQFSAMKNFKTEIASRKNND